MKQISVLPEQIIGLNDYPPLHSPKALIEYFEYFKNKDYSKIVPIPLIPIVIVLLYFIQDQRLSSYIRVFEKFISTHHVEFFQMDGKHRASAAYLAKRNIIGIIIENDSDITKARTLKDSGKFGIDNTFEATINGLKEHFLKHPKKFWNVAEKTEAMISNGDVPKYMVDYFESK